MFKVNNKLLTFNLNFTPCSSVLIVNFDHVITGLVKRLYHG